MPLLLETPLQDDCLPFFSSHRMKTFPRERNQSGPDSRRDHILSLGLELFVLVAFELKAHALV